MNYQKIYEQIISNAQIQNRQRNQGIYYENHHIMPKCLGGLDELQNLVLLTAKEHFIVHKLLTFIYPDNRKISLAFHYMINGSNKKRYPITSRDYEYSKILISINGHTEETKRKIGAANKISLIGNKLSEDTKEKISKANKGKRRSKEARKNYSDAKRGVLKSEDHKKKLSDANKGQIPWNKGMKMSKEFCEKTKRGIENKRK